MKVNVKCNADLIALFPELAQADKFSKKVNQVFKLGYCFDVEIKSPLTCFTANTGRQFKAKITRNGSGFYFKKTALRKGTVGLKYYNTCPELFKSIDSTPCGACKVGDGDPFDLYMAEYEVTNSTSWAEIGKFIGKLIKNEFIEVCTCAKCNGTGFLPHFAHYAEGVCFSCLGVGKWIDVK